MEPVFQAHPIPQNVTNFEFHLVGDMTLKQFGYLAAGVGLAFLVFTTLSTSQPILAWPIIVISALLGVAFAFLPIQERPLDHWVVAFFKAIFQPTSLKFASKVINPGDPLFNRRLNHYIRSYRYAEAKEHALLGNPNLLPSAISNTLPSAPQPKPQPQATLGKKQNFIDKFKSGQTSFAPPASAPAVPAAIPQQKPPTAPQPVNIPQVRPPQAQVLQTATQALPAVVPIPAAPVQQKPPAAFAPIPGTQQKPLSATPLPDLNQTPIFETPKPPAPEVSKTEAKPVIVKEGSVPAEKPEPKQEGPVDLKKTVELAKEAQETQKQIVKIEQSLSQIKQQAAQPGIDPKSYVEDFEDLLSELQELNQKASATAKELAEVSKSTPKQPETQAAPIKAKSIPTLKLTSFPNVVNGIVTDSTGNYIEGAIVVAHDKQGLPVRALKSNKLGQFVAATPLPNGEYTIVVEKDNLAFDKVGIELKNEILPPILIAAKKLAAG